VSNRLALGTAQFGLRYGIANRSGQVNRGDARTIVAYAAEAGLTTLDTAMAYGDSETRLGEIGVAGWQVISKLPALPHGCSEVSSRVWAQTRDSLRRLRVAQLHGLLLHRPQDLLEQNGPALYETLQALKERGAVEKIGVSIYDPDELAVLTPRFRLDIVQAPFNVIDRRLVTSGWLARLHAAGIDVHARSLFLQGLLLMESAVRPEYFNRWQSLLKRWQGWLEEQGLTPLRACLGFVLSHPEVDRAVVGVDCIEHLHAVVADAAKPPVTPPASLTSDDADLINPSRWTLS
jgi:aryl-alcohol dehydrogenase-like predicted oxidoreductase